MIEESLLKSNYIGKDGFIWWIGQVAHPESWRTEKSDVSDKDIDEKWGYRCKVRIIGYHTFDGNVLPDSDLPWAHIMLDPAFGSGQGGLGKRHNIVGGETAFGFFLDGEDAQQPVIVGLIYRTSQSEDLISESLVLSEKSSSFKPFRGDVGHMAMKPLQRRELPKTELGVPPQNTTSKNLVDLAFSVPSLIETNGEQRPPGRDQIVTNDSAFQSAWKSAYQYAKTTGENGCDNNIIGKITKAINDFINVINGLRKTVNGFIDPITNTVVNITNFIQGTATKILGLIKGIVNNMRSTVIKLITKLFRKFIALIVPIPQQNPIAEATKNILDIIFCIFERLLGILGPFLESLLNGLIGNTLGSSQCQSEQFAAGLISKALDIINDLLAPIMSGLSWLTGGIGQLNSILSQATSVANQILNFIGCDNLQCKTSSDWSMAFGVSGAVPDNWANVFGDLSVLNDINSNIDNAIGFLSLYGSGSGSFSSCNATIANPTQYNTPPPPYGTQYSFCIPPIVTLYGGGGIAAQAVPIVSNSGQIIAIEITDGGFGYDTPPTVNIVDNTGHGSGATAGAIVENGSVTGFYITDNGEGYCPGNYTNLQATPYYITTADKYSILEGQSVTFTITAYNLNTSQTLTYAITGDINQDDIIQPLTGSIELSNNTANLTINTVRDDVNDGVETIIFDVFDSSNVNVSRVFIIVSDSNATVLPPNNSDVESPPGTTVPSGIMTGTNPPTPGIITSVIPGGFPTGITTIGIVTTISGIIDTPSGLTTSITNLVVLPGVTTGISTDLISGISTSSIPGISTVFFGDISVDQGISAISEITGISTLSIGGTIVNIPLSFDVGVPTAQIPDQFVLSGASVITGLNTSDTVPLSETPIVEISGLSIIAPGNNYTPKDNITVGVGVTFDIVVDDETGAVVGTNYLGGIEYYSNPPEIRINTEDGEGALIYPIFKLRKQFTVRPLVINQGGILEVIDCV